MPSQAPELLSDRRPGRFSVLLATNYLYGWTGSETLLLTLIEALCEGGCELAVYARHLDRAWADRFCGRDIFLTDDLKSLESRSFDLAHVQHSSCLIDVRAVFPQLPIVFSSLGVLPFLEQPPPFECGIAQYLAISEEVRANLIDKGIPSHKIEIVRNLVSESRFSCIKPLSSRPERILVISNRMNDAKKNILREAALFVGATIRFIGGADGATPQKQLVDAINGADLVVSLGRGVVEAMLCGRVPLVFDIHGGDGLVTPDNLEILRTSNFSGRYYRKEYTVSAFVSELEKYRPEYGEPLRKLAVAQFGVASNLARLLQVYARVAKTKPALSESQSATIAFCSKLTHEEFLYAKHVESQIRPLSAEIHRIKHTVSWQITKPLRLLANLPRLVQMVFKRKREG